VNRELKSITEKDVLLLASFLTDPKESTQSLAKDQLQAVLKIRPDFKQILESIPEVEVREKAWFLLEENRLQGLEEAFRYLVQQGDALDLEKGAYLLATFSTPGLTRLSISQPLEEMARQVQAMSKPHLLAPEFVGQGLGRYLFEKMGFRGNIENYHDPRNSYINHVLERRTGIPISLSALFLFIAWRLGLKAYGIGLPGHFIVGHEVSRGTIFLDPFNRGKALSLDECRKLVERQGIPFRDDFLMPATPRQTLARMMVNLINIYTDQGTEFSAHWMTRFLEIIQE